MVKKDQLPHPDNNCIMQLNYFNFKDGILLVSYPQEADGKYYYKIFVDGVEKYSKEQTKPMVYENVKIYSPDPWYTPADADVKNIKYENYGMLNEFERCFQYVKRVPKRRLRLFVY